MGVDRLLTPEEAAEILAVSPKSIRKWLRQGKLKGVKAGKALADKRTRSGGFLKPCTSRPRDSAGR
jgi:excisionase family DNA binding protein